MKRIYLRMLLLVGLILMTINIVGLFISLKNDAIYSDNSFVFVNDIDTSAPVDEVVFKKGSIPDIEYVKKITHIVNRNIAHDWEDANRYKYNLHVPVHENWILWVLGFVHEKKFGKYEFWDYRKALERGIGLCSQHAMITAGILNENEIQADIVGVTGHVIVQVNIDGKKYIVDSDYGVIIPHDISYIEKNPHILEKYYLYRDLNKKSPNVAGINIAEAKRIYGTAEDNTVISGGLKGYSPASYYFEKITYIMKWLVPALLIFISAIRLKKAK